MADWATYGILMFSSLLDNAPNFTYYVISSILWKKKLICLPPVSFGLAHRKVTDLLSKSTILGSPGALGGPEKWKEVVFLKFLRQIK